MAAQFKNKISPRAGFPPGIPAQAFRFLCLALLACAVAGVGYFTEGARAVQQPEGVTVSGVVQDDRGEPIAEAKVSIIGAGVSLSSLTQADGKFEFRTLGPGEYRLVAEAARFRKGRATVTITKPDETPPPVIIKLTASSLRVAVVDASNRPLGGVAISLFTQDRGSVGTLAAKATTDESGDVYFGRLSPGPYLLTATLRGYEEKRTEVFISSDITTDLPLQLLVAPVIPINEKAVARYSVPNLPSKNVLAVFQDSDGWMWLGTDKGVARYNGADFKSPATGSADESLRHEEVRSIAEDRAGTIWVATARGVRQVSKDGDPLASFLEGQDPRQVFSDSRGRIWAATAEGLFRLGESEPVRFDASHGLPANSIKVAAEDKSGRIWVATTAGLATLQGDRITPFDTTVRTVTEATNATTPRRGAPAPARAPQMGAVNAIFTASNGTVWFATDGGVSTFDGTQLVNVPIDGVSAAGVAAISEDAMGRIWFALAPGGAVLYDPARRVSQRVGSLERDRVNVVSACREGMLWFGTADGAVAADYYSFVGFNTTRGLSDDDVRAVVQQAGGSEKALWFLTAAGVSRMEGERFVTLDRFSPDLPVRAVAFDNANAAWFATAQGAFRLSGQTLTQFNESKGLASKNVLWVTAADGGAKVIFGTAGGASVFEGGEFRSIEKLDGYDVRHIFQDKSGRLWFATSRGIIGYDQNTGESELIDAARGLADNDVRWIAEYEGRLWVATRGGVQAYARGENGSPSVTAYDADPAATLFVDRDNYLWVGTDDGQVKKFGLFGDIVVRAIYSGEGYGLTGGRINSFYEDDSRRIWVATSKGAVRHLPVRMPPPVKLSFEVDGRTEPPMEDGAYELPYGQQRILFRFAAVSMAGPVRYLYRLNPAGENRPWTLEPPQQQVVREVRPAELNSGAYSFELIPLNRDLYQLNRGPIPNAAIPIRVGSPFWKRWWFYMLALALIGFTLASVVAARRMREREYILPRELRSYVPIEPNPYIVGNPIRSETMFYGREDDFRYVRTKLEAVSQGVVIVFCGERRAGKSSILYQVLNGRLGDRFIPVFVDMQEMVISSDTEFFARTSRLIAEAVNTSLRPRPAAGTTQAEKVRAIAGSGGLIQVQPTAAQTRVATVPVPQFDGRNPYPVFIDFIDEVLRIIGDRTLLILMDEYELVESKVDSGKLSPELFTFLAGLMDNKERLALIFTGSRRLEERDKKYWRELLRRSLFRKIGFLSEKDTVRLITEPVTGRVVYGRGVIEQICRLTAGQPFYTQVICQNTIDYMNEHKQNWVTQENLGEVIAEIIDNPLPQMIYSWDGLSDDEKLASSLLAEILPDGQTFATARELRAVVKMNDYPVNLSENTIRLTLEEMFRRELLDKDATGAYRFKIDLFRLWIRRSHSIWQVVKEVRTL